MIFAQSFQTAESTCNNNANIGYRNGHLFSLEGIPQLPYTTTSACDGFLKDYCFRIIPNNINSAVAERYNPLNNTTRSYTFPTALYVATHNYSDAQIQMLEIKSFTSNTNNIALKHTLTVGNQKLNSFHILFDSNKRFRTRNENLSRALGIAIPMQKDTEFYALFFKKHLQQNSIKIKKYIIDIDSDKIINEKAIFKKYTDQPHLIDTDVKIPIEQFFNINYSHDDLYLYYRTNGVLNKFTYNLATEKTKHKTFDPNILYVLPFSNKKIHYSAINDNEYLISTCETLHTTSVEESSKISVTILLKSLVQTNIALQYSFLISDNGNFAFTTIRLQNSIYGVVFDVRNLSPLGYIPIPTSIQNARFLCNEMYLGINVLDNNLYMVDLSSISREKPTLPNIIAKKE
jgi:hypothetical protein